MALWLSALRASRALPPGRFLVMHKKSDKSNPCRLRNFCTTRPHLMSLNWINGDTCHFAELCNSTKFASGRGERTASALSRNPNYSYYRQNWRGMKEAIFTFSLHCISIFHDSYTECFKKKLYNFQSLHKCIQRICTVLWIVIMWQSTPSFIWELRFNVTFTGSARWFKKSFEVVFQILLCGKRYENVYI
jgi:hypothetical protein